MRISDWSSDVCSSDLETCGIHAEAFSTAEVAHGPMAVIDRNFPILVFPPLDEARAGMDALLRLFLEKEAIVAGAGPVGHGAIELPVVAGLHPVTAPITMIQSYYRLANALDRKSTRLNS